MLLAPVGCGTTGIGLLTFLFIVGLCSEIFSCCAGWAIGGDGSALPTLTVLSADLSGIVSASLAVLSAEGCRMELASRKVLSADGSGKVLASLAVLSAEGRGIDAVS